MENSPLPLIPKNIPDGMILVLGEQDGKKFWYLISDSKSTEREDPDPSVQPSKSKKIKSWRDDWEVISRPPPHEKEISKDSSDIASEHAASRGWDSPAPSSSSDNRPPLVEDTGLFECLDWYPVVVADRSNSGVSLSLFSSDSVDFTVCMLKLLLLDPTNFVQYTSSYKSHAEKYAYKETVAAAAMKIKNVDSDSWKEQSILVASIAIFCHMRIQPPCGKRTKISFVPAISSARGKATKFLSGILFETEKSYAAGIENARKWIRRSNKKIPPVTFDSGKRMFVCL